YGPICGIITSAITTAVRIAKGGQGMSLGILVIIISFSTGFFFYYLKSKRDDKDENFIDVLLLTIITNGLAFIITSKLMSEIIYKIIMSHLFLLDFIFPITSLIISRILYDQKKAFQLAVNLQSTNFLLEQVFNNPLTLIAILDKNFNFIRVNKAYAESEEKDVSFFPGKNHFDLYPSDAKPIFEEVVKTKKHYQANARPFVYANAPERGVSYWDWTLNPVLNENGDVDYLVFTLRNITEKVKLEETRDRLVSIIESSPDFIGIADKFGRPIYLNKAGMKLLEIENEVSREYKSIGEVHPDWAKKMIFEVALPEATKNGVWMGETAFVSKNGKEIPVWLEIIAHKDSSGEVIFYSTIARDITIIKEYEKDLKTSEEKHRLMVENLTDAVMIHREGKFLYANPAALKLIEANSFEDIKNIPVIELVHPDYREIVKQRIKEIYEKGAEAKPLEEKFITLKGHIKDVLVTGIPIELGGKTASMAIIKDITEIKTSNLIREILADIAMKLIEIKNLKEFFIYLRERLSKLLDIKNMFFAYYDEATDLLNSPIEWDEKMDAPEFWSAKESLTGIVVKEKKPLLLKREDIENLIAEGKIKLIGSLPECWLGVPVISGQKTIGAIVIQSYSDRNAYDETTKNFLQIIANNLSVFIEKQ
ncbi:MAG: PAS domain S-box protein, partial [Ignavibacteria bacterium]